VEHVNLPDGTEILPGTEFTKIWRLKNTGDKAWPENTRLVFTGGDKFVGDDYAEVAPAPAGSEVEVAISLTAPTEPGRYVSYWRLAVPPAMKKFGGEYEKPPCQSGEEAVQVQGLSGSFCSPSCSLTQPCPPVPKGTTAKGQCILETQGSSQPTQCALVCNPKSGRRLLGGGGGGGSCPKGATCQPIQGTGICTYPTSSFPAGISKTPVHLPEVTGLN